jgi:hypothetical protein
MKLIYSSTKGKKGNKLRKEDQERKLEEKYH